MIHIRKTNNNNIPNYINIIDFHLNCNVITYRNDILKGINTCLKKDKYSMIVLEYFDGTIFELINANFSIFARSAISDDKKQLFYSIFAQLLITIYLFHNKFNYYHNDAHLNNFLYKKVNNDNKYFHYKIGDKNYYIRNCGYLIVLSDYGLATQIIRTDVNDYKMHALKDYEDILSKMLLYIKTIDTTKNISNLREYINMSSLKNKTRFSSFDEFLFLDYMMNMLDTQIEKKENMILINEIPFE